MALKSRIPQVRAAITQEMDRFVLRVANSIRNNAVEAIMRGQKSGRMYGNHRASAPGEAPATDTGALVRSIRVEHTPGTGTARVVVGAEYAAKLEFGTRTIAPRPFLRPAVAKTRRQMPELAKSITIKVGK